MPVVGSTAFPQVSDCLSLVRSLLNDADIPSISIVSLTGAVRSSNQVTITTTTAHDLQVNNIIQVANVSDTSFNGTFQITSVPTSTTFTYAQTAADATSGTGTISNIVQGDVFTDAVLIPFVGKAYRKVQARLLEEGSKTATGEADVTLTVGQTALTDSTTPQLPVDFLAPRELSERITGSGAVFVPMNPVDVIPQGLQLHAYNRVWAWYGDSINFIGSSNSLDVHIRYFKGQANQIVDGSSSILIRGGLDVVADWTAFLAANSRGATNAAIFLNLFDQDMKELLNMQDHARQYLVGRRQPFRGARRPGNWGLGPF